MAMGNLLALAVLYLICTIFFIHVQIYSLAYYAAEYQASAQTIQLFFRALPSYWKPFYEGDKPIIAVILKANPPDTFVQKMMNTSKRNAQFERMMWGFAPFSLMVCILIGLFKTGGDTRVFYLLSLALVSVSLIKAWRFGHNLKEFDIPSWRDIGQS